jgi:7,8-dihydropterin-6-yl-methyl-4-(beta-D-ribofuranosyl)aminobenzene 5'-phosphate synthase
MKVQVVVDNYTENRNLLGEHGLSQLLRTPRGTLLFDAGQGRALEHNLAMLGISGGDLNGIVCSHGHYDHTWGIPVLLRQGWHLPIYGHVACGVERFGLRRGHRIPLGFSLAQLGSLFSPLEGNEELLPGIHALVVPPARRNPSFVPRTPSLQVLNEAGEAVPDPFEDDLSLLVEGRFGWSLLLGCAHSGVVNILEEAARRTGSREFYAVQGGMHLKGQSPEFLERVLDDLGSFSVQHWRPNHCTGVNVALALGKRFPSVSWAGAGSSLEL